MASQQSRTRRREDEWKDRVVVAPARRGLCQESAVHGSECMCSRREGSEAEAIKCNDRQNTKRPNGRSESQSGGRPLAESVG